MKTKLLLLFLLPFLSFSQANDLAIDSVFHRSGVGGYFEHGLTYYKIAQSQISPIEFSALVTNTGTNDLTGCFLTTEVRLDGVLLETLSSSEIDISSGNSDSLIIPTSLNPSWIGEYLFKFYITSDSIDENNLNDTLKQEIEVSAGIMSRSNHLLTDSISPIDSMFTFSGYGILFEALDHGCIYAIKPSLLEDTSGLDYDMAAILYQYNITLETFEQVNETDNRSYSEMVGGSGLLEFDDITTIEPGEVFLISIIIYESTPPVPLGQSSEHNSACYNNDSGLPIIGLGKVPIFDIMYGYLHICDASISENQNQAFNLGQSYPNPSKNNISIPFALTNNSSALLTIENQLGQIVHTSELEHLNSGEHSIQVNTQNWESGIYFYSLIVDGEIQTKSLIIE